MILNNFTSFKSAMCFGEADKITTISGNEKDSILINDSSIHITNVYNSSYKFGYKGCGVYLGDGNEKEQKTDFNLSGNILEFNLISGSIGINNGIYTFNCVLQSDIEQTIREIGLVFNNSNITNGYGDKAQDYLVYRKVLDTPYTVKAGEYFSVTIGLM